jgi:hypothetical protein
VTRAEGDHGADVDELFAVPPEEFVSTRNALVKRLKAAGERDRAAEIATWRRPTPIDWALNQVARDDREAIGRFVETAAAGRDAQAAALSGRREDLRAAVAEVRESSATVAALAAAVLAGQGRPTAPVRAAVSTRLAEIAADPSLAEQLAAGRLGAGTVETDGVFALGGAEDGAAAVPASRERAPARPRRGAPSAPAAHAPTDRAERAQAKKQAAAEAKRERERARAVEKAERAAASAQAALAAATESLERAEADCATARKALDRAEREREKAVAEHDRRREAALDAAGALEQAQQR